jgi:hypothetical protein
MRRWFLVAGVTWACNATPAAQSAVPAQTAAAPAAPAVASAAPSATDSTAVATADAQHVAELWLATLDAGKYAEGWTEAATPLRSAVAQPAFVQAMTASRAPLGALKTRALRSATYATSVPGAPDGQYVVMQFDTTFDKKQLALETVTPMKDADGQWRVSGYFIK